MNTKNLPQPALVESVSGVPVKVNRSCVSEVRDEWRTVDKWWTDNPEDIRHFDVVLETGHTLVVFQDNGEWFTQRSS